MAVAPDKKFRAFDVALGRVIASKRIRAKLTQAQVAADAGMPLTNLGRVEAGKRSLSVAEFEMIAKAVGVSAEVMATEAVELYGGLEKLQAEAKPD